VGLARMRSRLLGYSLTLVVAGISAAGAGLPLADQCAYTLISCGPAASGSVVVLNLELGTVSSVIQVGEFPVSIVLSPDGRFAYVGNAGLSSSPGTVSVVDTTTRSVVGTVGVGVFPRRLAITPDGSFVYVANEGGNGGVSDTTVSVSVIDAGKAVVDPAHAVTATIPVGFSPTGVAISPDGSFAYVVNSCGDTHDC
jgi:YVTN family beta-propeller protein